MAADPAILGTADAKAATNAVPATAPAASVPNDGAAPVADKAQAPAAAAPAGEVKLDPKAADTKAAEAKPALPEKYALNGADGKPVHALFNAAFGELARASGWNGEQAQKHLDGLIGALKAARETPEAQAAIAAQEKATRDATHAEWAKTARADREYGGAKLDENLALGVKALRQFGGDALYEFLEETGLNKHPEFIRFAYRVGKATSNDTNHGNGTRGAGERKPLHNRLVPNAK